MPDPLDYRRQRVKFANVVPEWLPISAGVPQGTKLGAILFLIMVNHLQYASRSTSIWKCVDEVSTSETLERHGNSDSQNNLDTISNWASNTRMKLNIRKCKEMRICFIREKPTLPPLIVENEHLDIVTSPRANYPK